MPRILCRQDRVLRAGATVVWQEAILNRAGVCQKDYGLLFDIQPAFIMHKNAENIRSHSVTTTVVTSMRTEVMIEYAHAETPQPMHEQMSFVTRPCRTNPKRYMPLRHR